VRRTVEESGFRRRLVCGAFTGVGPSFILPLRSVNTYASPVHVCIYMRARAQVCTCESTLTSRVYFSLYGCIVGEQ
jgi:hypothetical protein